MSQMQITIDAQSSGLLALGDAGLFLYDLATLYELLRLALDPAYADYRFGKYPLFRGRRPLEPEDRLDVDALRRDDGLHLVVSLPVRPGARRAIAAVLAGFAHGLSAAYGLDLDARALQRAAGLPAVRAKAALTALDARGARPHFETVIKRLRRSEVKVTAVR